MQSQSKRDVQDLVDAAQQAAAKQANQNKGLANTIESFLEENRELRNRIEELEREKNEAIIQKVNHYSLIIRNWTLNQKAYKKLANEFGNQLGINEESVRIAAFNAALEIAELEPELKNSTTYEKVIEAKKRLC